MSEISQNDQKSVIDTLLSGAKKMKCAINDRIDNSDNHEDLLKLKEEIRILDLLIHGF